MVRVLTLVVALMLVGCNSALPLEVKAPTTTTETMVAAASQTEKKACEPRVEERISDGICPSAGDSWMCLPKGTRYQVIVGCDDWGPVQASGSTTAQGSNQSYPAVLAQTPECPQSTRSKDAPVIDWGTAN